MPSKFGTGLGDPHDKIALMTSSIGPRQMGQCCTARLHVMQQQRWRHGMNSCVIGWRTSAAGQSVKGIAEYTNGY